MNREPLSTESLPDTSRFAVVVNDDPTQLDVLAGLVRKADIEPRTFAGAEAALAAMSAGAPPSLIVTDLNMPGIDGWRFCRLLRSPGYAALNHVPILVVSATYSGAEAARVAVDLGAEAFLPSPVDGRHFCAQVRAILSGEQVRTPQRVLIVEESALLSDLLKELFTTHGYKAEAALTVQAATEAFKKAAYDVAVLNHHLADGTGEMLLEAFRTERPDCVCLMITSDPRPELPLKWMKMGAAAYLRRPFDLDYLIELCNRARRERALLRVQDIIEARTRELRQSEERFRNVMSATRDGLWDWDVQSGRVYYSPAYLGMLGYSPEDKPAVLSSWFELIHPEDSSRAQAANQACVRNESQSVDVEFRMRAKDGSWRWIWGRGHAVRRDANGQALQMIGTHTDITERKRAAEALREANELLVAAVTQSPSGILIASAPDVTIRLVNPAALTIRGGAKELLTGIDVTKHAINWQTFRPDGSPFPPEQLPLSRAVLKGEVIQDEEAIIRDTKGRDHWVSANAAPIYDAQGRVTAGIVVFHDITAQKESEAALREAEWKFRALFENGPIGVAYHRMIYDDAGKPIDYYFIDANEKYMALTGVDPRGKTVTQAFPGIEKDPFDWIGVFGRVARTGESIRFEQYLQFNNRWYDCVSYQYKPDHFVAAFLEITKRKQAEDALRRNEARQRAMVANIGDVIVIIDQDGINRYKSPNIEKWFGWLPKEVVGVSAMGNVHPDDIADAQKFIGSLVSKPNATGTTECRYRCKDGSFRWIEFTGVNLLHDPDICGLLGNYKDITVRKQVEAEKARLEVQFQQAQKMESVGRLAGGVAHDFNNMLQAILGNTDLALEEVPPGSPVRECLEEIRNCAGRSAALTRQLLAFARRQTISPEVLDLNAVVEDLLKMLRRLIGEDIDLAWLPAKNLGPVKVDPTQVDQILANLCINARDAIEGVGRVTIETANAVFDEAYCADHAGFVAGEYVRLTVSDNGCGMDKATLAQIFEPFFTTKRIGEGTGLGLATVYGIVKQNHGFINVYSEPGHGTTFTLYLPRHADEVTATRLEAVAEMAKSSGETVLLVEDEPAVLGIARIILVRLGYSVLTAGTPGEAIRLAEVHAGEIHLLITDVVMPEMNGRDLERRLSALHPKLKCLFMSGYTANVIAHHGALKAGVHFIQKPFSMGDLAAKVREALGSAGGEQA